MIRRFLVGAEHCKTSYHQRVEYRDPRSDPITYGKTSLDIIKITFIDPIGARPSYLPNIETSNAAIQHHPMPSTTINPQNMNKKKI